MITVVALCALGAERALSNEVRKLNYAVLDSLHGKVRFTTDIPGLYRALLSLRTADRVLLELASFPAPDFDALFEGIRRIPLEEFVRRGTRVTIEKVRTNRSRLTAVTSIQAVVHKAAAERLCTAWGIQRLPDYGDPAELRVYLEKDRAAVLLDVSGEPLFKRGYRTEGGAAPLRETTAAAILLLSGWKRKYPLYDPFCGSGTIAIEAALYAWDAAPGLGRSFALSRSALADDSAERAIREELAGRVDFSRRVRIFGSDADARAVSIAKSNAQRALELARGQVPGRGIRISTADEPSLPRFTVQDMRSLRAPEAEGSLVTNPPYGERLGDLEQAEAVYRDMETLTDRFSGWQLEVVTNHAGFESHFGHAADTVRELTNGALRTYLYHYERLGRKTDVHRRGT